MARPTQLPFWAVVSSSLVTQPAPSLQNQGYVPGDVPLAENFNYMQNLGGQWHEYLSGSELAMSGAVGTFDGGGVRASGSTTSRTLSKRFADVVNVRDYTVGDGVTDDTAGFTLACSIAVSTSRTLDICSAKLYLSSQTASINSDGLHIIGDTYIDYTSVALGNGSNSSVNWGLENGDSAQFDVVKSNCINTNAGVIFSKFSGSVFTGKSLRGERFTVIGFPGATGSQAFKQTTPTSYPGWSLAFHELHDASFFYFQSHGLQSQGGLEVTTLRNIQSAHCGGHCLLIGQTVGVNSPVEYIEVDGGAYDDGLLGNITLQGVTKMVHIHDADLSNAGQLNRRNSQTGFTIAAETDIVYPIYISPLPASQGALVALDGITVNNNYSEFDNALVVLDQPVDGTAFYKNVIIEDNFLDPLQNTVRHVAAFKQKVFGLQTDRNFTKYGPIFWFDNTNSPNSINLSIKELFENDTPATFDNYTPTTAQMASNAIFGNVTGSNLVLSGTQRVFSDNADQFVLQGASSGKAWSIGVPPGAGSDSFRIGEVGISYPFVVQPGGTVVISGTGRLGNLTLTGTLSSSYSEVLTRNTAATLNTPTGRFVISSGSATFTLTDNCIAAKSIIWVNPETSDTTFRVKSVTPTLGIGTIAVVAGAADVTCSFQVVNGF